MYLYLGDYAGFDEKEPTSKNGGKAEVIHMLKEKYGYSKLFMIGDGITDLEACPPADVFIGKFWSWEWCVSLVEYTSNRIKTFDCFMFNDTFCIIFFSKICIDIFVKGFGGNTVREEVKSRSKWYVESFQELIDALWLFKRLQNLLSLFYLLIIIVSIL